MQKFNTLKSIPAYLPIVNIDTDMIIPKQFLKTIKRTGLGKNLFFELRPVTLKETTMALKNLKPKKSSGNSSVPKFVIKGAAEILAFPL